METQTELDQLARRLLHANGARLTGLNANWCTEVWELTASGFFVCDDEDDDGTWTVVERSWDAMEDEYAYFEHFRGSLLLCVRWMGW